MIEKLFKLINFEDDYIKENLKLDKIEIIKETKDAKIYLSGEKPLPILEMKYFCDALDSSTIGRGITSQKYYFHFNSYTEDDVKAYYKYIIQRLSLNNPSLVSTIDYTVTLLSNTINIQVPSIDSKFNLYRNQILNSFKTFGFDNVNVYLEIVNSNEDIKELIRKEKSELIQEIKKQTKEEEYVSLIKKELYGKELKISDLPDDSLEDFTNFKDSQSTWNFLIQGDLVFFDFDNLDKRGSVNFVLRDDNHYVYCVKRKLKSKEEERYFSEIKIGDKVFVQCYFEFNQFQNSIQAVIVNMKYSKEPKPITTREDIEPVKRVELHLHTKMSSLDAVPDMIDYINVAKQFGHTALAITDHSSVQSFHDLYEYTSSHKELKPIYGVELSFVDEDKIEAAYQSKHISLEDATYVVFDLETTGFSTNYERIIEISAVKIQNGIVLGTFSSLVNPEKPIPSAITKITGIKNRDVENAKSRLEALSEFKEYINGSILVAHNAEFDISHLYRNFDDLGIEYEKYPVIDTLVLSKLLFPERKYFSLDRLCSFLNIPLVNHHRALEDARATGELFLHLVEKLKESNIKYHDEINSLINKSNAFKLVIPNHINLIVRSQEGMKNLYHLLSIASTDYFQAEPIITKDAIEKYREGLLVGSGCRNSYFFDTAFRKSNEELESIIDFYDYIEVQPLNSFNYYKNHMDNHVYCYTDTIKRIITIAKKHSIPVCATGDCHQINKEDTLYRDILVRTEPVGGERWHYLSKEEEIPSEYYMTTREMLDEFSFLGEKLAYEIVVENTNLIADAIEDVKAFSKTLYPPKDDFMKNYGIPSAEEYVKKGVYEKASQLYGELLPGMVLDRIREELDSIIKNKFSTIYLISQLLVDRSRKDGYIVGSRGSVGSSFVAYLLNITEVNSLPPHYRCPKCHYTSFKMSKAQKEKYGIRKDEEELIPILDNTLSGFDLPNHKCPICGEKLIRDGHDIPFETFLGVPQDPKTPDIDLNFSGDNRDDIHEYIRELFGMDKAFRAGTILTCQDKTAYAIVRDYFELVNNQRISQGLEPIHHKKAEIEGLSYQVIGIKRTSSQHPGGIVVVPEDIEIYDVTPVQYPGDSKDRSWKTTHYEYHSFEKNLFKLDVLGHDDPTVIRYLMKYVKMRPTRFPFEDAMDIPVDDSKVYQMMNNTESIGCNPDDIMSTIASYGISELGTGFVRGLLEEARPKTFAELVKVSGLSHGTNVWNDNAQTLLRGTEKGLPKIPFKDIIGCRDDIMINLISFGVPEDLAFQTMEFVRKGRPTKKPAEWDEFKDKLSHYDIPNWYIWSCNKIKYLFPKAHATAYVISALRIAWFKYYRPIYFYSAILSKKMTAFDVETMIGGVPLIRSELERLKNLSREEKKAKDDGLITTLEICLEMCIRGFKFYNVSLEHSEATEFLIPEDESGLYIPFMAIDGLGLNGANSIVEARKEKHFSTKNDFMKRTSVTKTIFQKMEVLGVFDGMPDDNQMTLNLGI